MYLKIGTGGALSMEEIDDFKQFHISAELDTLANGDALASFEAISEDADDEHFWLEVDAVVTLAGRSDDEDWIARFWSMLEKAAPYGFADLDGRRIKAHVT